ncbi:MAG: hypothetical protein KGI38_11335 [Thaumarchaeota archaeon]|nr:hypothetical protein [Nitrososphaerota archaeon]
MKHEEIGEAKKVETVDLEAIVHVRGNAALEADLIRRLQDEGKGQAEIGKMMGLSQGAVSKRLALFNLIPQLLAKLRKGEIGANVAYRLAKLPKAEQAKFAAQDKITLKAVDAKHRDIVVSDELKALLAEPLDQGTPKAPVEAEGLRMMFFLSKDGKLWTIGKNYAYPGFFTREQGEKYMEEHKAPAGVAVIKVTLRRVDGRPNP